MQGRGQPLAPGALPCDITCPSGRPAGAGGLLLQGDQASAGLKRDVPFAVSNGWKDSGGFALHKGDTSDDGLGERRNCTL